MLPTKTKILIVGAGPAGMAAALSLHAQGFKPKDITLVDALLAGQNTSRAMVIQAATLEALDSVDCLDALVKIGTKLSRFEFVRGAEVTPLMSIDFNLLAEQTKFPFGLAIPQAETERVMLEKLDSLGMRVLRPFKVVAVRGGDNGATEVVFESGEVIRAEYVIGADGAHSMVREQLDIPFADPDGETDYGVLSQMALADLTFTSPPELPSNVLAGLLKGNFTLLVPFPSTMSSDGSIVYRYVTGVPPAAGEIPHAPSKEYFQSLLDASGHPLRSSDPAINPSPHQVKIDKILWSSRYRPRAAIAGRCFARAPGGGGPVFLIGDAAHIHSPIGGQGLSLGVRDAISLGPVLRAVVDGAKDDAFMEEWGTGRRVRALEVIALSKRGHGIISASAGGSMLMVPFQKLGLLVLNVVTRIEVVQRAIAWRVSGLGQR
ncbi:FAD-binding-3 domain-containing protein [Mycena kentingensis (nom. inval.)]|nr:FAD-binding-3 domain-containing protein [Mycena kentingensis (nom. inval.)]